MLSTILAMTFGFRVVLVLALGIYVIAVVALRLLSRPLGSPVLAASPGASRGRDLRVLRSMITLVDLSTHHPGRVVLDLIAAGVAEQVRRDLAPAWDRRPVEIEVASDADAPAGVVPVVIFDDGDQAGVLGFHSETPAGRPYARVSS